MQEENNWISEIEFSIALSSITRETILKYI